MDEERGVSTADAKWKERGLKLTTKCCPKSQERTSPRAQREFGDFVEGIEDGLCGHLLPACSR